MGRCVTFDSRAFLIKRQSTLCNFFTGENKNAPCIRCDRSWEEHYPAASDEKVDRVEWPEKRKGRPR